jgi:hypothetical protein
MVPKRRQGITTTRCVMTQKSEVLARYVCPILNKTGFAKQFSVKVPDITVHGYPSSRSRTDVCRQTDRQRDVTNQTVAFHDYTNARKNRKRNESLFSSFVTCNAQCNCTLPKSCETLLLCFAKYMAHGRK